MHNELAANLLKLASDYEAATKLSKSGVGKSILNDTTFFKRIEAGDGFNVKTYDRVVEWFSANWPARTKWPRHIERPKVAA